MSNSILPESIDFSKIVDSIKKALGINDTYGQPVVIWEKLKEWAKKAGRTATKPALLLYFTMKDGDIPTSDKALIYACLAYAVLPIKVFRMIPFGDLIGKALSIGVVIQRVRRYITPEIEASTEELLEKWFGAQPGDVVEEVLLIED